MPRLALGLPCLLVASIASAQSVDELRPAVDSRGYLTVNGSSALGHGELSFGLGSLTWGNNPTPTVDDVVTATLVGAIGVRVGALPLELGVTLPFVVTSGETDRQAVGDGAAHLKARLGSVGPIGFAAIASVSATGDDSGRNASPQLIGVVEAALGRWRLAANAGVRRTTTMAFSETSVPVGGAAAWALVPERFEVIGEVFGTVGRAPRLEALGGIKTYLARNSYLALAIGRGLTRDTDTPDLRAMIGIVFEPKAARRGGGRIEAPEPLRVASDDDRLRDRDTSDHRDDDAFAAIPDTDDSCKRDPDCPKRKVVIEDGKIVPLDVIEFEFDKAIIRPSSYTILDAVVDAMRANPDIDLIEIRGHTDERGSETYNRDLSDRRAAAVVAYLIGHGVDEDRLTSIGYGESLPLDPAHTEAAWRKNRRVEFLIRKRKGVIQ